MTDLEVRSECVDRGGAQFLGDQYDRLVLRAHVCPHKSYADGRPDGRIAVEGVLAAWKTHDTVGPTRMEVQCSAAPRG
ncbi:hypothetical protein SSBG_05386 [Streptomyces sp. SPB074]|nr:hypothetical protein SSBG_05386 [Streptomyces sp. SPB074]